MKILFLFIILIVTVSCNSSSVVKVSTNKENAFTFEKNYGIYLPQIYIDGIKKTKSHLKSCELLGESKIQYANVLVLNQNGLFKDFNFHEGYTEKILQLNDKNFVTESQTNPNHEFIDSETFTDNGINYVRISNIYDENKLEEIVSRYFVKNVLNSTNLRNNISSFITNKDGTIQYNGKTYIYSVKLIFVSTIYDRIISENDVKYIENLPDKIQILTAKIPKIWESDPFGIMEAEYTIESEFKKN